MVVSHGKGMDGHKEISGVQVAVSHSSTDHTGTFSL